MSAPHAHALHLVSNNDGMGWADDEELTASSPQPAREGRTALALADKAPGGCAGCRGCREPSARRVLAWRRAGIAAGAALVALVIIGVLRHASGFIDQGDEPAQQ